MSFISPQVCLGQGRRQWRDEHFHTSRLSSRCLGASVLVQAASDGYQAFQWSGGLVREGCFRGGWCSCQMLWPVIALWPKKKFCSQLPVWWYPKNTSNLMRTCRWFFLTAWKIVLFSIHFSEKTNKWFLSTLPEISFCAIWVNCSWILLIQPPVILKQNIIIICNQSTCSRAERFVSTIAQFCTLSYSNKTTIAQFCTLRISKLVSYFFHVLPEVGRWLWLCWIVEESMICSCRDHLFVFFLLFLGSTTIT